MVVRSPADLAEVFASCTRARGLNGERFTAWSAWETFADFAGVRLAGADGIGADSLLYQWGTFFRSGRRYFHLVLSRQVLATRSATDAADGVDAGAGDGREGYLQLDVRMQYESVPALSDLGRFESSWLQDGERAASSWIAQISGRPEWAVLNPLRPGEIEISAERV